MFQYKTIVTDVVFFHILLFISLIVICTSFLIFLNITIMSILINLSIPYFYRYSQFDFNSKNRISDIMHAYRFNSLFELRVCQKFS